LKNWIPKLDPKDIYLKHKTLVQENWECFEPDNVVYYKLDKYLEALKHAENKTGDHKIVLELH